MVRILIVFYLLVLNGTLYSQVDSPEKIVSSNPIIREADIMLVRRVWQKIDIQDKRNLSIFIPFEKSSKKQCLFYTIIAGIALDRITVFSGVHDDFTVSLTKQEALDKLKYLKVNRTIDLDSDPEDPSFIEQLDSSVYSAADIICYLIKEDWAFDKKRSLIEKRIIGLSPVVKSYANDGTQRGYKSLFWIYYPNSRNYFANNFIYTNSNDTILKSFDDFFINRRFYSTIVKVSNVQDRNINESNENGFLIGIDALNESEAIKAKMLELEFNLWQQ